MIENFAYAGGEVRSKFLDLTHTRKSMILVFLVLPRFALEPTVKHRRTSEAGTRC